MHTNSENTYKVCGQLNIPEVDNTASECDVILSAKCVALDTAIPQLSAPSGEILHDILVRIGSDFKKLHFTLKGLIDKLNPDALGGSYDFTKDEKLLKFINDKLNLKVDKIVGKGLSSNDFTDQHLNNLEDVVSKVSDLLNRISTNENVTRNHSGRLDSLNELIQRLTSDIESLKNNSNFSFRIFDGSRYKSVQKDDVVKFTSGSNINAVVSDEGVSLSISETPNFRSVGVGGKTISDGDSDFNNTKIGNVLGGSLDSQSKEVVVGGQIHTLKTDIESKISQSKNEIDQNLSNKEDKSNKKSDLGSVTNEDDNYPNVSLLKKVVKTATDKTDVLEAKVDAIKYGKSIAHEGTVLQLKDQSTQELSRVDLRPIIESVSGSGGGSSPTSLYMWIKYSSNSDGEGLTSEPQSNSEYIGVAINKDSIDPSLNKLDYKWFKFKGDRGDAGERGLKGEDGERGADGRPGVAGENGADGKSAYVHIRYSANADGTGFTQQPASETIYMGVHSSSNSVAPVGKSEYVWVRIRGVDGSDASVDTSSFTQRGGYDGTAKDLKDLVDTKVDKQVGKDLSTNDYSNEEKGKVAELGKKVVKSISFSGTETKRLTLTFEDSTSLTADFSDKDTVPPITKDTFLSSMEFDTGTGIFTGVRSDGQRITANLNGRFALLNHNHNDLYNTKQEITNFLAGKVDTTDPRLTDSRNAKDVPDWAKELTKPIYSFTEILNLAEEFAKYVPEAPKDSKDYIRNNGVWKVFEGWTFKELGTENLNDLKVPGFYGKYNSSEATTARNYPYDNIRGGHLLVLPMTLSGNLTIFQVYFSAGTQNSGDYTNSARIFMRAFVNNSEWLGWREFDGGKVHNVTENTLNLANAYKGFPVDNSVFVLNQATNISVPNSILRCRFIKNTSGDITFSKVSGVTIIGKETISLPEGTEISLVCNGNRAYVNTGSGESVSVNHDIGSWD